MREELQTRVQNVLQRLIETGGERGLQVAAYYRGELVVHAWAGVADIRTNKRVAERTLFPVFSSTKGPGGTVVNRLAERGLLDYDRPLAEYWPGFGRNGKERVTLRQTMNHSAGLPQMPDNCTPAEACDWALMCEKMTELEPLWQPGSRGAYHAITYSWLIGEPACIATGKTFPQLVRDEIVRPLGLEGELYVGVPLEELPRVAWLEDSSPVWSAQTQADPVSLRAIPPQFTPLGQVFNDPALLCACLPASNGVMTARALAAHYAALLGDGLAGERLLSKETVARCTELNRPGGEAESSMTFFRGLGYSLSGPAGARGAVFGHGGYGGSLGLADQRYGLAVGIAKNQMSAPANPEGSAAEQILRTIREGLNLPE